MTINWRIDQLECKVSENGLSNVVSNIECVLKVTDIINNKSYTSGQRFSSISLQSPNSETFVEYDNLTQEQVVEWITDYLGESNLNDIIADLSAQNSLKANPTTIIKILPFED